MTREQLEQQAERNRAAVADTLEELNQRLTPGQIVDQVMGYMKNGGGDFLSNLGRQVTDNPMPVTLIGAGLAWFLLVKNSGASGNGYATGSHATGNGASYVKDTASGIGETASAAAGKLGDMASATANGVSGAVQSVSDTASNAYNQAADGLSRLKGSAMDAEERTVAAARSAMAFCQNQPLVLAGVGLALGAAIGAALPKTDLEDRMMGETSDDMKESAKGIAVEQLDKTKALGHKIGAALQEDVQSEGPFSDRPSASYIPQVGKMD